MKIITLVFINIALISPYYSNNNLLDYEDVNISVVSNDFLPQIQDINTLLNGDFTGFVYIGRDSCPFCLEFNSILKEFYLNDDEIKIYKFDTDFWREDYMFNKVLTNYNINSVPSLLRIDNNGEFEVLNVNLSEDDIIITLQEFFNFNND